MREFSIRKKLVLGSLTLIPFSSLMVLSSCNEVKNAEVEEVRILTEIKDLEVSYGQEIKSEPIKVKCFDKNDEEIIDAKTILSITDASNNKIPSWISINNENQICVSANAQPGNWLFHLEAYDEKQTRRSELKSFRLKVINPVLIPDQLEVDCPSKVYVLAPKVTHLTIGLIAYKNGQISYECDKSCKWEITSINVLEQKDQIPEIKLQDLSSSGALYVFATNRNSFIGKYEVNLKVTSTINPDVFTNKSIEFIVRDGYEFIDEENGYVYTRKDDWDHWALKSVPEGTNTINYVKDNIYDLPVTEVVGNLFPATHLSPTLVILTLPKSITKIGQNAFKDQTKLITIAIPGVTHVCKSAFENCTGLRFSGSDKQPKLEIVEDRAFYDARYISFEVNQNFKEIGKEAFYNIYSESITSEGDCTFIDADAFKGCKRLKEFIFYDPTPATLGGDIFSNHISDFRIKVLLDFKDLYVDAWPLYSTIIDGFIG